MIVVVDAAMLQISVVVVAQGLPLSVWSDVWSGNIRRWLADWGSCYEAGRGDPLSQQHHHHHHHYRSAAYNHHQYVEVMVRRCAYRAQFFIYSLLYSTETICNNNIIHYLYVYTHHICGWRCEICARASILYRVISQTIFWIWNGCGRPSCECCSECSYFCLRLSASIDDDLVYVQNTDSFTDLQNHIGI